jgi:hypothetical protein
MPTVLRIGKLRFVIYPNDHRPAHVHIIGNGCEALFFLNSPDGPVSLRENYGFALYELKAIQRKMAEHLIKLCASWEEIHG